MLGYFADGAEVVPEEIAPRLQVVESDSEEELLFRYARLSWSIPTSAGYGRRLRFLIWDDSTGKLMGLIGLGDPVFSIRPRDEWVGWDQAARKERLRHVVDAFVVGAVPPYSSLLIGKFIAMLLASDEVRTEFRSKYKGQGSLISGREFDGTLAMITTTSALGRSSVYNRVRFDDRLHMRAVGFTSGSGEFHFSNGLYSDLMSYARAHLAPTAKHGSWGGGWRNRREVVRQTLRKLDLNPDMLYHGIRREVFVVPLAANTVPFLNGSHRRLRYQSTPASDLFDWFQGRWLLPRAERKPEYRSFSADRLRIWRHDR